MMGLALLALVFGTWAPPCDNHPEIADGSWVTHEVELTAVPTTVEVGSLERDAFAVVINWGTACSVDCADTPCIVAIPDPGEQNVVFRVDVGEIVAVGPKEPV